MTILLRLFLPILFALFSVYAVSDEISENSAPGEQIYLCTPYFVEIGKCTGVDNEYYRRASIVAHGGYEIGIMEYTFQNERDSAISILGGIAYGMSDDLRHVLKNHPEIDTLVVSSAGGDVREGIRLYNLISSKNLDVIIPPGRACFSSCADAMIGAENIYTMGLFGFHSFRFEIHNQSSSDSPVLLNALLLGINFDLQVYQSRLISNRYQEGIDIDFNHYIAKQRGDFVTVVPPHQGMINVKNIELTPESTAVLNNNGIMFWVRQQTGSDLFEFHSNRNVLSVY